MDAKVTWMHASCVNHRRFSFGDFVLDVDRGALLEDGVDVPLRPKTFKVLNYLVLHAGLLVSKEDLRAAVWPDVVVTDDSLTQCLIEIRRALEDDSRNIILTVRGRGYLFDLPVEMHERNGGERLIARNVIWSARVLAAAVTVFVVTAALAYWGFEHYARQSNIPVKFAISVDDKIHWRR